MLRQRSAIVRLWGVMILVGHVSNANSHYTRNSTLYRHIFNRSIDQSIKGPSIKYVTLFLANFDPLPLSHFVTHPGTLPKSTSHISDPPRFLVGLVQKSGQKLPVQILSIVREGFCPGAFVRKVLSGVVLARTPFCQNTSVTTESLKITLTN